MACTTATIIDSFFMNLRKNAADIALQVSKTVLRFIQSMTSQTEAVLALLMELSPHKDRKTLTRVGIESTIFGLDHRCSTD